MTDVPSTFRFPAFLSRGCLFLGVALFSGCAVGALRSDYRPPVAARPSASGPVLNLSNFDASGFGAMFDEDEKHELKTSLKQCILNSGRFSKVTEDPGARGNSIRASLSLKLDKNINWWQAWPAIYPFVLYWPLQPYTMEADASFRADGVVDGRDFAFSSDRKVYHKQTFYGFFLVQEAEAQLSQAYDQMFLELRDKLVSGAPLSVAASLPAHAADTTLANRRRRVRNIAVMDFESNGVDAAATGVVADELVNGFISQGRYGVLERRRMDQILKEQGFQKSGACDNGDCSVEVGKLLGVDAIVSGSLTKIDKLLVANIRIVDVGTGLILFATQVRTEEGLSHLLGTDLKSVSEQF
jgi:hypothetical protein